MPELRPFSIKFNYLIMISAILLVFVGGYRLISLIPYTMDTKADFYTYYHAAELIITGQSIYSFHNMQPPSTCLIFLPVAFFPYKTAAVIWVILTIFAYLSILVVIDRELRINLSLQWKMLILGLALSWYPFLAHISVGQVNILLSLMIILAWSFLRRNHKISGGVLLGLACVIKLFPGIFIFYLFFRKQWKALLSFSVSVFLGFLFTASVIGIDDFRWYFLKVIPQDSPLWSAHPFNLSLRSTIDMIFLGSPYIQPIVESKLSAVIVTLLVDVIITIIFLIQQYKIPISSIGDDIAFSICIIVMLLLSPITWQHIYPILVLPVFLLISRFYNHHKIPSLRSALLSFLFLSIPSRVIASEVFHIDNASMVPWYLAVALQIPMIGAIILWIALSKESAVLSTLRLNHKKVTVV